MKLQQKQAFTLVELIIVITILAILATIGFMSYQSYTTDARDTNRITTVKQISNGLDITFVKKTAYPLPDGTISTGTVAGTVYAYKGTIGDTISQTLRMTKSVDPSSKEEYVYGVNLDKTQYQIATVLENNTVAQMNSITNTTYADSGLVAKVNGNYPGYVKYSTGGSLFIANIPSLLWNNSGAVELLNTTTKYVVDKKTNLPYKVNSITDLGTKDANTIVKEITGTGLATLTGVNISSVTSSNISNTFSGVLLASFGGDITKVTSNVVWGSVAQSTVSCGTANGKWIISQPINEAELCNGTTSSSLTATSGGWTWNCSNVSCSAVNTKNPFGDNSQTTLYRFENINSNIFSDEFNLYNATLSNPSPTLTTGKFGNGVLFGNSKYLTTTMSLPTSQCSFSLWVTLNSIVGDSPLSEPDGNNYISFASYYGIAKSGIASWRPSSNGSINTINTSELGNWINFACTDNGTNSVKCYKNGIEFPNAITTYNKFCGLSFSRIGARADGYITTHYFDGAMDSLRIFNKALTPSQITQLYNEQ